jgi:dihydroorotate dehydrogenase
MIYPFARRLLFRLAPETAHRLTLASIARAGAIAPLRGVVAMANPVPESEPVEVFGLKFPNRVGLAAGYDKDAEAWRGLAALGFGHVEVGTVTPLPQPGNPSPRVFRLPEVRSVINRLGFPGKGAEYVARRLRGTRSGDVVIGVNIGKQKSTPLEEAAGDYERLMDVFAPLADYLAVNISSPNTPDLRRLQERGYLESLLGSLVGRRDELAEKLEKKVPLLVKLAPDLTDEQLETAVGSIIQTGVDGIIATNTTIDRDGLDHPLAHEQGGLSGAALSERSTRIIHAISRLSNGAVPLIGVGGIMTPKDAQAKIDAGATLVQIYTGLIYEGPGLIRRIVKLIG